MLFKLVDKKKFAVSLCVCLAVWHLIPELTLLVAFGAVAWMLFSIYKWKKVFSTRLPRSNPESLFHGTVTPRLGEELQGKHFDSQYLSLTQYLFGQFFVQPNAVALQVGGILCLLMRRKLFSWGFIPRFLDHETLVAKYILGTSLAMNIVALDTETHRATFRFRGLPKFAQDLESFEPAEDIIVTINARELMLEEAWLGEQELNACDVFVLLNVYLGSVKHVHEHSYGNWGVDPNHPDVFLRLMSVVSVNFNSYGNVDNWVTSGAVAGAAGGRQGQDNFQKLLDHVNSIGVEDHRMVRQLAGYSTFVNFVLQVRLIFFKKFGKYEHLFEGISKEGLFQATVMHSLDHSQGCKIWADPLWIEATNPEYEGMAWTTQIIRAGFSDELPWILFHRFFKDSPHPFFREVYHEARIINQDLADAMETCIVR